MQGIIRCYLPGANVVCVVVVDFVVVNVVAVVGVVVIGRETARSADDEHAATERFAGGWEDPGHILARVYIKE